MTTKSFEKLSWELLRYKVAYYCFDTTLVADATYDKLEREYVKLCKKLKKPNTIQSMVGVDLNRPSVMLVRDKLKREMDNANK